VDSFSVIILTGAAASAALGVATLLFRPQTAAQWSFLAAVFLLAVEGFLQWFSLRAPSVDGMLFWQRSALAPLVLLSPAWLVFSLSFARGDARRFLQAWRAVLLVGSVAALAVVAAGWSNLVTAADWTDAPGHWVFQVGWAGKVVFGLLIVGAVLVLANLEGTVRSAVGTARWKIKYTVIGLGLWCGAHIYTGSQVLLYSERGTRLIALNAVAATLACLFFSVAVFRSRIASVEIYPSPSALHKSLAVILAGGYLALVGVAATLTSLWGGAESFPVVAVVVLVGLGGFGVLCLSDRVRLATRRFVSRHFKRPSYDYRRVWSRFTQRTALCLDPLEYARHAVGLVSETFEALSVTVWLAEPAHGRFAFAASTSLDVAQAAGAPVDDAVYRELADAKSRPADPVDLNRSPAPWCVRLRASNPVWFPRVAGECFCLPLAQGEELIGLLVVGDRVAGQPFTGEDLELLKCLGDQMAAGLRTLGLSGKLVQAREMEAFQMMSAFLVHDLKNTASALALTLKNLPRHFDNPAFREDALRTLSRSVQRVNDLIARLSSLRGKIELKRAPADLNQIVAAARQFVGELPGCQIVEQLQPLPRVPLDAVQIESVIVNLLLNAREAITAPGEIRIETGRDDRDVFLAVSDNGCGMSAEFLTRSLFKPFQTSKKNGLGIGMYQTRTIIEAHGGRIAVQSEPGRGTRFRVSLPLDPPAQGAIS
jgi:putative PEP-CTERM system histidine kinase